MPRGVFSGLKIGITGDFGSNWTKEKFARFIKNNDGAPVDYSADGLTHLICTIKAYEENGPAVRQAKKRKVALVSYDWFEDSLQARKKKREVGYRIEAAAKQKKAEKEKRQRIRQLQMAASAKSFSTDILEIKDVLGVNGYAAYVDPTGFTYDIPLLRICLDDNRIEKVQLRIVEAQEPPFFYAAYSTYFDPMGHRARTVLAPIASSFEKAFEEFKNEFERRTKKPWIERANGVRPLLKGGAPDPVAFTYRPPELGTIGMDLPPARLKSSDPLDAKSGQDHAVANNDGAAQSDSDQDYAQNESSALTSNAVAKGHSAEITATEEIASITSSQQGAAADRTSSDEEAARTMRSVTLEQETSEVAVNPDHETFSAEKNTEGPKVTYSKHEMKRGIVTGGWGGYVH